MENTPPSYESLILGSDFALNNSMTKRLKVGVALKENSCIVPSVQIYGVNSQHRITIAIDTWEKLTENMEHIVQYFDDVGPEHYRNFSIIECGDLIVGFGTSRTQRSVIFTQNQINVVMHGVTVKNLWKRVPWVNEWLDVLLGLRLRDYLKCLTDVTADFVWTDLMKTSYETRVPCEEEIGNYILNNYSNLCHALNRIARQNCVPFPFTRLFTGELFNFKTRMISHRVIDTLKESLNSETSKLHSKDYYN